MKKDDVNHSYSILSNISYVYKQMFKVSRLSYVYAAVYMVLLVAVPFALALLPGYIISLLEAKVAIEQMLIDISAILLVILFANILMFFSKKQLDWIQNVARTVHFQEMFNHKILSCDYLLTEGEENQRKIQAASSALFFGSYRGIDQLFIGIVILIGNIIGFLLYTTIISFLELWILLLLLAATFINYVAQMKARDYENVHMDEFWENNEVFWYLKKESTEIKKAKDIRLYQMQNRFSLKFDKNVEEANDIYSNIHKRVMYANQVIRITSMIRDLCIYVYLIYAIIDQSMSIAEFVIYSGIVAGFSNWLEQIVLNFSQIKKASIYVDKLREFIAMPTQSVYDASLHLEKQAHEIVFEDVSFGYDENHMIFDHFNLTIKAKEKIALVGVNGAGKTTLMKLLCGLYPLNHGRILVDGIDIAKINKQEYYQEIAMVFQEINEMAFSIAEFVSCSINDDSKEQAPQKRIPILDTMIEKVKQKYTDFNAYDERLIIDCLKEADLWEKVSSLPKGIHTNLTKALDKEGVMLSGGEMQKLMLARALYKAGKILILDEPTAALDPIAESVMYEKYADLCTDKTSIFISHRLSSTKFCDRIIFLKNGQICEEGSHEALLAKQGEYTKMFNIQAHYYQKKEEENEAFGETI